MLGKGWRVSHRVQNLGFAVWGFVKMAVVTMKFGNSSTVKRHMPVRKPGYNLSTSQVAITRFLCRIQKYMQIRNVASPTSSCHPTISGIPKTSTVPRMSIPVSPLKVQKLDLPGPGCMHASHLRY